MKIYKKTAVCAVLAATLLLSGCRAGISDSSSSGATLSAGGESGTSRSYMTLLYSSADSFNPYTAKTDVNRQLCRLLYEPLVKLDDAFNVSYSVARAVELNGTECRVTLKDVDFSDGTKVTADDVVYSFNLAKNSGTKYAYKLYLAKSASASGSESVIFRLEKADPYFANVLDFPIIKKGSDSQTDSDSVSIPPVGCGRYKLNEDMTGLVVNGASVDASGYNIKEIQLINAPDEESLSHYVEVGAADMYYSDISDGNILRMSGERVSINLNNLIYIGVNNAYGDLTQEVLRQAISSGIDRSAVCRDSYYNNAIAANGFFNPLWEPVKSVQNIETTANAEITIENLEKIGYNNLDSDGIRRNKSGTGLSFELLVNSENRLRVSAAKLIAEQLSQYGFRIKVVEKPYSEYTEDLNSGNFQLYLAEVAITPNMDLSNLVLEGGSAAYGIKKPEEDDENAENGGQSSSSASSSGSESAASGSESSDGGEVSTAAMLIEGFYSGKNTAADIASALQTEMPFIPVCYRTGVLFYNDNIENVNNSSVSDIYFSIESYKFK